MALSTKIISFLTGQNPRTQPGANDAPKPDSKIDVYRDSEKPPSAFREIATLADNGHPFELGDIEAHFIRIAKEMGADAVHFFSPVKSIQAPAGWRIFDTFRCFASVIVYEHPAPDRA